MLAKLTLRRFTLNEPLVIVFVDDKEILMNICDDGELETKNDNVLIENNWYEFGVLTKIERDISTIGSEKLIKNSNVEFTKMTDRHYWIPKL